MDHISRRKFIGTISAAGSALLATPAVPIKAKNKSTIKALAFDGFPIFDPRPVFQHALTLLPEHGEQFMKTWLNKQFGYQWLRVAAHQYKNFYEVTVDALDFTLEAYQLKIEKEAKDRLMQHFFQLNVWPDVLPALKVLKSKGLTISLLSNMTSDMLKMGVINAGAQQLFDYIISTDQQKTFKPSPDAYQMGVDMLGYAKEEILFVAFAGWDMAGAKWFGYPTFWMNRMQSTSDKLDATPDGIGKDMQDLLDFVAKMVKLSDGIK